MEGALRVLGLVPIALSNARARYPDLAHLIRRAPGQGFGMDDDNLLISQALTATYQRPGTSIHPITRKCCALDGEIDGRSSLQATRGDQCRLCKPVAGIKGCSAEAAGSKGCCKALQSLWANGFSPNTGYIPTAQIEGRALLRSDLANTQVIGEIRPSTGSSSGA